MDVGMGLVLVLHDHRLMVSKPQVPEHLLGHLQAPFRARLVFDRKADAEVIDRLLHAARCRGGVFHLLRDLHWPVFRLKDISRLDVADPPFPSLREVEGKPLEIRSGACLANHRGFPIIAVC